MSMMLPPDPSAAPNLPIAPGGGEGPPGPPGLPGPMDSLNQGPIPGGGGISDLMAALGGGGGGPAGPGPGDGGPTLPADLQSMDPVQHIQVAMQHLMMALAKVPDETQGSGIVKGMGALQAILGGKQKDQQQRQTLANAPGAPAGP